MSNAQPAKKCQHKVIGLILLSLMVLTVVVIYFGVMKHRAPIQEAKINGMFLGKPLPVPEFKLTDNGGQAFTKDSLKGHWTMMFFGFTSCGMVCPTTLSSLNKMYISLAKDLPMEQMPQVVMVTVDPERDSIQRMNSYVTAFNPQFIGARASRPQLESLEQEFHLVSVKMQVEGQTKSHYTINHSAEILVFNPRAELQAFLSYPHEADEMARDYKSLLSTFTA